MPGPGSDLTSWLLDGDPAVRWRVHELYGGPAADVVRERRRVATQGWGARLIAEQDPDGQWAGGLYTPKWTSTTYTLLLLHRLGVPPGDPAFRKGSARLWDGSRVLHGGANIGLRARRAEQCISGLLVLLAAYADQLDDRVDRTVSGLLGQQRSDGGWNCVDLDNPGRHSSFHTSILVLEALLTYERAGGTVQVAGPLTQGRGVLPRAPAVPVAPVGAGSGPGQHALPVPAAVAFRRDAGARAFRGRGSSAGSPAL